MIRIAAVDDHVACAQLGHQRRVAVEHFEVAVLRGQLDRRGRVLEERALGSDEPDAELIGFVCHKYPFRFSAISVQGSELPIRGLASN